MHADLTDAQRQAVLHVDGPLLILAGPGSGKTRVITHRIVHLLEQGIPAWRIVALTFTNKAADEIRSRVEAMLAAIDRGASSLSPPAGGTPVVDEWTGELIVPQASSAAAPPRSRVWMSTFHRFCSRLLRQYATSVGLEPNFAIYDTSDSRRVLQRAMDEGEFDILRYTPERIAAAISHAKNNLVTPEEYAARPGSPLGKIVADVYPEYQSLLRASNAVDFDDLLLHSATLLRENGDIREALDERYRYILVDEYQDTNLAQYTLVRALSIDHPNLAVTGDPDQSIYGWRGANLRNILDFEQDYPQVKVVRLEQNYRSTKKILRAADALIIHNKKRKAKALFTDNDEGRPVRFVEYADEQDEAAGIAEQIAEAVREGRRRPSDFAVFYRVNALSRTLEDALRDHGIPYQIVNGVEFYGRKEVKDVVAYLALLNNPRDDVAFQRVVNTPPRGIGKTTLARLSEYARRFGVSLLEAARDCRKIAGVAARSATAVQKFVLLFDRLSRHVHEPVEAMLRCVLEETGYSDQYSESQAEDDQQRLANIQELVSAGQKFDERFDAGEFDADPWDDSPRRPQGGYLERFLEQASLVNDTDAWESDTDRVTLMTMHAAKGLEFPVVFIVAVEENLIPHERSKQDADDLEEERRLLFVAMTRAEQELQLSSVRLRAFRGNTRTPIPSLFRVELPEEEIEWRTSSAVQAGPRFPDPPRDLRAGPAFRPRPAGGPLLTTAAALAEVQASASFEAGVQASACRPIAKVDEPKLELERDDIPRASPDDFTLGMTVLHPDHGPGKILSLSGSGPRRVARVVFPQLGEERSIFLFHSQLVPVKAAGA